MDTAIFLSGATSNVAIGVEQCLCGEGYNGTSCQDPADGFYRWKEPAAAVIDAVDQQFECFIGRAVRCDCNGRSSKCDRETGHCRQCSGNTSGPRCDRCAEGFYGDPASGCASCPCPETQRNFARGCTFTRNRVSCICKPGYAGDLCESCAPGFYGSPGNDGGNCTECDCDRHGSVSGDCDAVTGHCRCKDGVTGKRCSKCEERRSILENGHCKGRASPTRRTFHSIISHSGN